MGVEGLRGCRSRLRCSNSNELSSPVFSSMRLLREDNMAANACHLSRRLQLFFQFSIVLIPLLLPNQVWREIPSDLHFVYDDS